VGRTRISKIIIPYCVIFTNNEVADKSEAGIFNNINFKQLPLKQEKNIQNIQKYLRETEELGYAHNLTMKLIDLAKNGHFKGIEHLNPKGNDDDVYRTACYKIATLLIEKKPQIEKEKIDIENKIKKNELENNETNINNMLMEKYKNKLNKLNNFTVKAENLDKIEIEIQSLQTIYAKMDDKIGNLSLLTTLVYYKLLDESKFNSFVDWILRNGINKIPVSDELPTHDANSLIGLFERVYEAKRKEIFISMKFEDTQSKLIYEKVKQTIDEFNKNKGLDISITQIRIDKKIKPCAFTIPEEILTAIENSGLIIADLSSSNINVYHEIGYAMGIARARGIEPSVILLYKTNTEFNKDTDVDKFIGFNLRSTSQLRFTTDEELTGGLTKWLEVYFEI